MSDGRRIVANVRTTTAPLSGVQRYTLELMARLGGAVDAVRPARPLHGMAGHLWEQAVLPWRLRGRLLWSPANAGPLAVARQVVTVHDVTIFDHPEAFGGAYGRWYRALLPRLVARAARVIAVSEFTRERLIAVAGARPERVTVVHNGVTRPAHAPGEALVSRTCAALGVAPGRYVLAVGSLEPRKNLATLLEAWRVARPRLPADARLLLVGRAGLERVFGARGALRLPEGVVSAGFVEQGALDALYAGAAALASLSLYEGFGLPLLEAASAGVPVLASDIPVHREVLGDAARFAPPHDAPAVAAALAELLDDAGLRAALAARGRANAGRFSWDEAAARTLAVLREAAEG